jgi:hypothetical protein
MKQVMIGLAFMFIYMESFSQNVGIGKENPQFRLDVLSTSNSPAKFEGGSPMFIGLHENGVYRGYIGSFSGADADVDFGTGSGNSLGKVHLTTQAVPRLTIRENGYVGINNINPQWHLDVEGGMRLNGRLFVEGTSGGAGQVLTSGGGLNKPSWQTLSTAFDNNVRFGVQVTQNTSGGTTTNSRSVFYNTNTTAISTLTDGRITIHQPGLYHFEGNYVVNVEYQGQTIANNTSATCRLIVGLSQEFNTHYIVDFKKFGTGSNWRGREVVTWEKDLYITPGEVPINVNFGYSFSFAPTNGATLVSRSLSGIISGYKIAD